MRLKILHQFLLLTVFFLTSLECGAVVIEGETSPSFVGYLPDKIVVEFDEAVSSRIKSGLLPNGRAGIPAVDRLAAKYDAQKIVRQFPGVKMRRYRGRRIDLSGWHKIHFRKKVDVAEVVAAFKKLPGVINAQPIGIHRVLRMPNDPQSSLQWHLEQVGGPDINAPDAWELETGRSEIIVAVPDTGVRWFHRDLGGSNAVHFEPPGFSDTIDSLHGADGNLWINEAELNGIPGVDDDGNEYIDDMIGWDFVGLSFLEALLYCYAEEDCLVDDNDPRDFDGHGTHVSGIIAALNNNGYAVSSTSGGWGDGSFQPAGNGVKIMPLRIGFLGNDGFGYVVMDWAADAIAYAAEKGAHMINCSWGSSNSGGLGAALDAFLATGGLVFKAAGNAGNSVADYMGGREDIIKVAATGQQDPVTSASTDCKASFSSYGSWVDISAPGVRIWSLYHVFDQPANDYIAHLSGTSMASPLALSVAALIWSQNPTWTADQVKQKLFDTADAIDGLGCNTAYAGLLGAGRVNAYLAVGSCEGDFEGDGDSDGKDLAGLIGQFNCATGCSLDVTYDDAVNEADLDVFAKDFGRITCP